MRDTYFSNNRDDAPYITRSTAMSGEIARLDQPAEGNVSYALEFWGTSLRCQTVNRTVETTFRAADVKWAKSGSGGWEVPNLVWFSGVRRSMDEHLILENTTITHRLVKQSLRGPTRYYPCLATTNETSIDGVQQEQLIIHSNGSTSYIDLPEAGIHVLVPVTETVCHPKISRYSVNITHHSGGIQAVSHTVASEDSVPAYHREFVNFDGSFEQWVQFSDALTVYSEFAYTLDKSIQLNGTQNFHYDAPSENGGPYILSNGTSVDTCLLQGLTWIEGSHSEIWPLSVFERRLTPGRGERLNTGFNATLFDAEMANELLINSTISMLSLNKHFDEVNGTSSRAFNVYRFRNKLAFFLPYGLSLGLSLPIIVLGLAAFYMRNRGVSAITGGFLQVLMTTTGRGSLEDVIVKGSGTMGGRENVSEELEETMIRFGELTEADDAKSERLMMPGPALSVLEEHPDGSDTPPQDGDHESVRAKMASGIDISEEHGSLAIRAGFGVAEEVRPLGKRTTQA
jgi:hypothetical protein